MIATVVLPVGTTLQLDAVLADALVFTWSDLMPEPTSGLIHIEYHVGPQESIEFLKVWAASAHGQWDLVCEYFMYSNASTKRGLRFANSYKSEGLARMLDSIMQRQEILLVRTTPNADHMIQVTPPTEQEILAARRELDAFRGRSAS